MAIKRNIYLIGPMGSGKTSAGIQLAKLIGATFIDSDAEIEKRTGVSIAWIFEKEQEAGFRKRETQIISELTQKKHIVMGTGGGSILSEKNRQLLQSTGTIVHLTVSLDVQLERTRRRKGTRPLLNEPNPKEKLAALNEAREPIYAGLADFTIHTDKKESMDVAREILKKLPSQYTQRG